MNNISFITRAEAVSRMNEWGRRQVPFFFLTDADGEKCLVEPLDRIPADELRFAFPGMSNAGECETPYPQSFSWLSHPQSFETYSRSFEIVYRNLHAGNSFLTNLTCMTPVDTDLTLLQVFEHAKARYRVWLKDCFACFSPEIFVRIQKGYIYSYPMKGTLDATLPDAAGRLLADEKETAEHATIVDLIRNDLSQIATEVCVPRYRYLETLQTHCGPLLQMSSEVRGRLPENYLEHLGTFFFRLLPAGSVTGAPKKKTVDIIHEAETGERGFYTGVAGWFDGQNLDSAVLIRFLEQTPEGRLVFKSGGGITFQSDVKSEYEEMKKKVYVPIY